MAKGKTTIKSAGGIGESKIFCAPSAEPTGVDILLDCHLNGKLIRDLELDPQVLSAISYTATDEGIAESNARDNVRESSGITQGKGPFEKALDERRDDVKNLGKVLFDSRDPLKEVADRYAVPGMRPKFLSAASVKSNGGTGIHEVVKDKNGDPVSVKGMILGHTPEETAQAYEKHFRDKGNNMLGQISEQYKAEGGKSAIVDQ